MINERDILNQCINVLNQYIVPDSELTSTETFNKLIEILDNKNVYKLLNNQIESKTKNQDYSKVTRLEIITHPKPGRELIKLNIKVNSLSLQDDGKTLKVFLTTKD